MPGFPQHGGSGGGVWVLTGDTIEPATPGTYNLTDGFGSVGPAGSFAWGGGNAPSSYASALSQGTASSTLDFAANAGSTADSNLGSTGSAALAGGYIFGADSSFAVGVGSFVHEANSVAMATGVTFSGAVSSVALAGGATYSDWDVAIGVGSIADSFGGTTGSVAITGGNTTADAAFAVGAGSVAAVPNSAAFGGAATADSGAFAAGGPALAKGSGGVAFASGVSMGPNDFASGSSSLASGGNGAAFGGATASANGAFAVGLGSSAEGAMSIALCGGTALQTNDLAIGYLASVDGDGIYGSVAFGDSEVTGGAQVAFAAAGGIATANGAVSFAGQSDGLNSFSGTDGLSTGEQSTSFGFGTAAGFNSFGCCGGVANDVYDFAVGGGSIANGGSVIGTVAMAGGTTTNDGNVAIGPCLAVYGQKLGDDEGALFSADDDGAGAAVIYAGASHEIGLSNVTTQTTVGASGAASPLPALPALYLVLTVNGQAYAFPGYTPV